MAYPSTNVTPVCLIQHLWEPGLRMITDSLQGIRVSGFATGVYIYAPNMCMAFIYQQV